MYTVCPLPQIFTSSPLLLLEWFSNNPVNTVLPYQETREYEWINQDPLTDYKRQLTWDDSSVC